MKYKISSFLLLTNLGLVTGCFHEQDDEILTPSNHYAVISQYSYPDSDVSVVSLEDYSVVNDLFDEKADIDVATHGNDIFVIGRYGTDNITKFSIEDDINYKWQVSVGELTNPQSLIIKDEKTAYVVQLGTDKILVVNPSATTAESVISSTEIDISSYNGSDGIPEAAGAVLVDNKLYVMIQNLDRNNGWTPGTAYIAVIDTNTNTEIDTNGDSSTPKGIQLNIKNPGKIIYNSSDNRIYLSGSFSYSGSFDGGIEAVNVNDYSTELLVDDGISEYTYGQITSIAILNSTLGYFVGASAYANSAVYSFNPKTKEVNQLPITEGKDIQDIAIGPLGNLWVTDRGANGVNVYDTVDHSIIKDLVVTDLPPSNIEFISVPKQTP